MWSRPSQVSWASGTSASVPSGNPTITDCFRTRSERTLPVMQPPPPPSARPAPPAATAGAGAVAPRQPRAQLLVGRELVEQATLEPAAVAEQPAVGQRHVLRPGPLHRGRGALAQVRRAAQLTAARPDPVEQLGGVARADLALLDAGVELA